jgi:predicted dehydrogenase
MSNSLVGANEMISASKKAGTQLSICFAERYQPYVRESKILIDNGILGDVLGTQLLFHHDMVENYWTGGFSGVARSHWRGNKEKSGGGILAANLVHFLDIIRYLTGLEVVESSSFYDTLDTPVEVEDSLVATCRYNNGAIGCLNGFNCVRGTEYLFDFRIWGENGHISLSKPLRFYTLRNIHGYKPCRWHEIKNKVENARVNFIQDFSIAILSNKNVPVSGEDGKAIQALIQSLYSVNK